MATLDVQCFNNPYLWKIVVLEIYLKHAVLSPLINLFKEESQTCKLFSSHFVALQFYYCVVLFNTENFRFLLKSKKAEDNIKFLDLTILTSFSTIEEIAKS